MRGTVLFDDGKGELGPLIDLRASFEVRTGALTTAERWTRVLGAEPVANLVPEGIADLVRERSGGRPVNEPEAAGGGPDGGVSGPFLFINGRSVVPDPLATSLAPGEVVVEEGSGDVVAAVADWTVFSAFLRSGGGGAPGRVVAEIARPALLARPWHVRTFRDRALAIDLELLGTAPSAGVRPGVVVLGDRRLTVHPEANVYPSAVLDVEEGPIVIDAGAVVRPLSTIIGPAYIGPGALVADRALIKAHTAVGPRCKVGGEIEGTVFQGFSNKVHEGHLGDSWVGEWVNFGAGTTNSNLLNTYGEVIARATPGGPMERTGERFFGCVVGDHAKFAICTRIMTGAVVHTGAMWAASAPVVGCVGRFAWVTDGGGRVFRFDKFVEVAKTVMGRRGMVPSAAYLARLASLNTGADR